MQSGIRVFQGILMKTYHFLQSNSKATGINILV